MKITTGMPVKAYLKKYVYWKECVPEDTILDLYQRSNIRMTLEALLTGKMTLYDSHEARNDFLRKYPEEILCRVTPHSSSRELIFFGQVQVVWFNQYLYRYFHDDLLYMILINKQYGISESDTINTFIDSIGIRDDISFEAVKKSNYRLRKDKKLPVFSLRIGRSAPNPYQYKVSADFGKKELSPEP